MKNDTGGYSVLSADELQSTIARLGLRIDDRFPGSGLSRVCERLHRASLETAGTIEWISTPNYALRFSLAALLFLSLGILLYALSGLKIKETGFSLAELVQMTEAGLNEVVIIGAGVVFMVTLEGRRKRGRVISSVNRLRCLAHIIDMHQLTKDPDGAAGISQPTPNSPRRVLTSMELGRYLDYCSEMLSLCGKLAFLYIQDFDDPEANNAVNEFESLTTGLSRKIWQKIMIINGEMKGFGTGAVETQGSTATSRPVADVDGAKPEPRRLAGE